MSFGGGEIVDIGRADVTLMHAMSNGRRDALATLYERYGALAFTFALRATGDASAAEEIVQDAFVNIWRRAAAFDAARCSPRTWLMSIVRNRTIDELRRRRRDPATQDFALEQPPAIDNDPWPEIWKRHCSSSIAAALGGLSSDQRTVIELGFYRGLSHTQIADALALPLGTVKKRMRSGLVKLRSALQAQFDESAAR